jgi:hypothetical protein
VTDHPFRGSRKVPHFAGSVLPVGTLRTVRHTSESRLSGPASRLGATWSGRRLRTRTPTKG